MDTKDFEQLVKWLGIPGALLVVFIFMLSRGYIIWRRELSDMIASYERLIAFKDSIIALKDGLVADKVSDIGKLEKEMEERVTSMRMEKNFWRQIALGGQEELERATRTVEKAVEKLPQHRPILPPEGET